MNLAKGVINTCVEAGIRTAAGWMVSQPQCQSSDQKSVSSILCRPLYLATSKFNPGTVTVKQGRSVMAGEVVTQGRMWKWSPRQPKVTVKRFSIPVKCFKTLKGAR